MKCHSHPEIDAVATCANCGKAICQSCSVDVSGKTYCQQCLASKPIKPASSATPTNPLAIVSLILGILGLGGCFCAGGIGGFILGIPAAIVGWIARKQILESETEQQGMPLAMAGLILGSILVILSIIVFIFAGSLVGLSMFSESFQ